MDDKVLNNLSYDLTKAIFYLGNLEKRAQEGSLKRALEKQKVGYLRHRARIERYLKEQNLGTKKMGLFPRFWYQQKSKIKTVGIKGNDKLASSAIRNSTSGIILATKNLNQYPLLSDKAKQLASNLIAFEQSSIDNYKEYL